MCFVMFSDSSYQFYLNSFRDSSLHELYSSLIFIENRAACDLIHNQAWAEQK